MDERVSHILIRKIGGMFDVGDGPKFDSLAQLIEHYKENPMVESSGSVIHLKHPFHSTSFTPLNIFHRFSDLQERNPHVYGMAGFWEEFEVCRVYCVY